MPSLRLELRSPMAQIVLTILFPPHFACFCVVISCFKHLKLSTCDAIVFHALRITFCLSHIVQSHPTHAFQKKIFNRAVLFYLLLKTVNRKYPEFSFWESLLKIGLKICFWKCMCWRQWHNVLKTKMH